MARNFDGAGDFIHTSPGALASMTFGTLAIVVRRNSTSYNNLMTLHTSGGVSRLGLEIESNGDGNNLQWQYDGNFVSSTFSIVNADGWVLLAMGKATGTVTPRCHKYVYSTNTWTHQDAGGTATNSTAVGGTGTMRFGQWEGSDDLNGDIAIAAAWSGRNLSDAEVEQLAHSLQGWYATAPDALWLFDQQATSQTLADLTGGGANQSSITGTTVSTTSFPALSYGFEVLVPHSVPSAGGDATATPAATAAVTALPAATASASSTQAPAATAVAVSLPAASKTAGSTPTPAAIANPVALPAAVVSAAATVAPAATAAVASIPLAAAGAAAIAAPQPVAVVVTLPTAPVSTGATVTPAAIAATVALPASARLLGATTTPAAIATTVAFPTATVQVGGSATVSPQPIAAVASLPAVVLSAGSTVTPAMFATTVALPAGATALGAVREPATIAAAAALPSSARLVGAGPSPATIALVATVPRPVIPSQEDARGPGGYITASTPAGRLTTSTAPRYTTSTGGGRL